MIGDTTSGIAYSVKTGVVVSVAGDTVTGASDTTAGAGAEGT